MSGFAAATAVRREAGSTYSVDLDAGWSIGGRPNGGYLLAVLANAACDATERPHALATSGHFLRPPVGGTAEIRVEVVKVGRTVATARATLWQDGVACLDTLVTAGTLPGEDPDHVEIAMPSLPAPEECLGREEGGMTVELLDHVDVRLEPATQPFESATGQPIIRGWMRFRDGADAAPLALLLAVDCCPPTVFHLGKFGWAPTVELTALLRGVPAPGWLAFEARASLVSGGWFDEDCTVWDSTGALVAQSRQLALVGRS